MFRCRSDWMTCLSLTAAFSCRLVMASATVPSVTNLSTMETSVRPKCTASAKTGKHVHSTESVGTDISGYFTAGGRLGLAQSYNTHTNRWMGANT